MRRFVINLARSETRLRAFRDTNGHLLGVERFAAVDGQTIDRGQLASSGLIASDVIYTDGAIGSALSHRALWTLAVESGEPITVFEDDATVSYCFDHFQRKLADFRGHWDFIAWGWNFDVPLWAQMVRNVSPMRVHAYQASMRADVGNFQTSSTDSHLFRLFHMFGTMAYSVSPRGAKALLAHCFPLRNREVPFRFSGSSYKNSSVDVIMSEVYERMEAFVSVPPLAVSENIHESSTVLNP